MKKSRIGREDVSGFVFDVFSGELHAKRIESLSDVTLGVIKSGSLAIRTIGAGLAIARELEWKHAVKQADRCIGNAEIDPWELAEQWVPFVTAGHSEIFVALDWTEFDRDKQSTLMAGLLTGHGRTTPLLWKTWLQSELKGHRNEYEDDMLQRLKETLPSSVKRVTILADRGFGDSKLFEALREEWGFEFIIRFRGDIEIENTKGEKRLAKHWLRSDGQATRMKDVFITKRRVPLASVVTVHAPRMKEAWFLASSDKTLTASAAVKLYGRRFTIEESFRDIKDFRFGMGLSKTRVSKPGRRDRLLLVSAMAVTLLTMLGAAGEAADLEKHFKSNTSKKRTYSLFRQGCMYFESLPGMREAWLVPLLNNFVKIIQKEPIISKVLTFEMGG